MASDKETLVQFLENERNQSINFPVILRTQKSLNSNRKNYILRRNTPYGLHQYKKTNIRFLSKRGKVRVHFTNIPQKSLQYAKDMWNTLVDMQWRWLSVIVTIINLLAYLSCGFIFYIDAWISGDFVKSEEMTPCLEGIDSLWNFFMLGIETVTTTGYGYVYPTEQCKLYYISFIYSTLISIFIDGAFISVVYVKMNRPKERRLHRHMFTNKAVVTLRYGKLSLIIRVNDSEGKHKVNSDVRMYLIKDFQLAEEEIITNHITELKIKPFGMLFWPVDIVHEIGPESPLWSVSPNELMTEKLEIFVTVSGSSLKTGQYTRSQTSFLNTEIMWGYQFIPCLQYECDKRYRVDRKLFHQTVRQDVPLCSAEMLTQLQKQVDERGPE